MVVLTAFIGVMAVLVSWREIDERVGIYFACLLWVLAGITGVFMALDLFLFYFFWEVMLIPMYFLIGVWGHERRIYAAVKFFIFTLAGGLLMLVSILALYFTHGASDRGLHLRLHRAPGHAHGLARGVLDHARFLRRLRGQAARGADPQLAARRPHRGAHRRQSDSGGAAAQDRRLWADPLCRSALPRRSPRPWPRGRCGSVSSASSTAPSSPSPRPISNGSSPTPASATWVSCSSAIYSWNELALQGTVMQMICHGISTGALFMIVGMLYWPHPHPRCDQDGRSLGSRSRCSAEWP